MHQDQGAEHVRGEQERDGPREQAGDQREATEELEQRNRWPYDPGERHAHSGEGTGDTVEADHEELLATVDGEDEACDNAQDSETQIELTGRRGSGETSSEVHGDLLTVDGVRQ
jgi:hypothetical protein